MNQRVVRSVENSVTDCAAWLDTLVGNSVQNVVGNTSEKDEDLIQSIASFQIVVLNNGVCIVVAVVNTEESESHFQNRVRKEIADKLKENQP